MPTTLGYVELQCFSLLVKENSCTEACDVTKAGHVDDGDMSSVWDYYQMSLAFGLKCRFLGGPSEVERLTKSLKRIQVASFMLFNPLATWQKVKSSGGVGRRHFLSGTVFCILCRAHTNIPRLPVLVYVA